MYLLNQYSNTEGYFHKKHDLSTWEIENDKGETVYKNKACQIPYTVDNIVKEQCLVPNRTGEVTALTTAQLEAMMGLPYKHTEINGRANPNTEGRFLTPSLTPSSLNPKSPTVTLIGGS